MAARKKKAVRKVAGPSAAELASGDQPDEVKEAASRIEQAGGVVLTAYREPLEGKWVLFASLPLEKIEATPYQRELSRPHVQRLVDVIPKFGRFLDPVIAVVQEEGFWTPNGHHRLAALRELGAKAVVALVVPEPEVAMRILALNTEKAHNLKDKALEVARMEQALAGDRLLRTRPESDWAFEFEEAAYATLGIAYEEKGRLAGASLLPVLKRVDAFLELPVDEARRVREGRAKLVLDLDEAIDEAAARLKEAGFHSPYLKPFVAARVNPLRFSRKKAGEAPAFDATVSKMIASARRLDPAKVRASDFAGAGAGAGDE